MFLEALALVSFGTFFLKKNDVKLIAKNLGYVFGRSIGTLQGLRIQMDDHSKKNKVYKLHSSIRSGLQSARSITYDIASLASSNPRSSILYSRNNKPVETFSESTSELTMQANTPRVDQTSMPPIIQNTAEVDRLARLALADQELQNMSGNNRNQQRELSGADLVMDTWTESLIATSYSQQVQRARNDIGTTDQAK